MPTGPALVFDSRNIVEYIIPGDLHIGLPVHFYPVNFPGAGVSKMIDEKFQVFDFMVFSCNFLSFKKSMNPLKER